MREARSKKRSTPDRHRELVTVVAKIKALLDRIDREVPLLQLAISASGESLSTSLPAGISPSRLLQASTFLIFGDTQFAQDPNRPVQIGPAFTLSLYMLFLGHAATSTSKDVPTNAKHRQANGSASQQSDSTPYGLGENDRKPLWQEVLHKSRVRLCRIRTDYSFDNSSGYRPTTEEQKASSGHSESGYEYSYHLEIIEDLDDGRLHDEDRKHKPYDGIASAGIRESIPIHQLSKIFYTDTGRILNVGSTTEADNKPVLLLKRDVQISSVHSTTDSLPGDPKALDTVGFSHNSDNEDDDEDEQFNIDRQIKAEAAACQSDVKKRAPIRDDLKWTFPAHLDPEWIALEVYEDDDNNGSSTEDDDSSSCGDRDDMQETMPRLAAARNRSSLDSRVVDQIRNLSLHSSVDVGLLRPSHHNTAQDLATDTAEVQDFMARSPFGAVTSSLSLMEMLIRLTSLQEFQQASHLSIPDHILTFFLEETSTTGLVGERQWKARSEAKRYMGFDPYTDTPTS